MNTNITSLIKYDPKKAHGQLVELFKRSGGVSRKAAELAGVDPTTINRWALALKKEGFRDVRRGRVGVAPSTEIGRMLDKDPRKAGKMLSVLFKQLKTYEKVAESQGVTTMTVRRWIKAVVDSGNPNPRGG